jgi:hypothetical protein
MSNPPKKPKLTDLQLKDVRIEQLESEIQTLRKAYIEKQADVITLQSALARMYEEKIGRLEQKELDE